MGEVFGGRSLIGGRSLDGETKANTGVLPHSTTLRVRMTTENNTNGNTNENGKAEADPPFDFAQGSTGITTRTATAKASWTARNRHRPIAKMRDGAPWLLLADGGRQE
jgi:hypothetical protein